MNHPILPFVKREFQGSAMVTIIEVALGVALGLFIFANRQQLFALVIRGGIFLMLLALAGIACWDLYLGVQVIQGLPPIFEPDSLVLKILRIGFGWVFVLGLFGGAVGSVLEDRLGLAKREATVIGIAFWALLMISANFELDSSRNGPVAEGPLIVTALLIAWILLVQQCVSRARNAKRRGLIQPCIEGDASKSEI